MPRIEQMLLDASHKRDLAKKIRNQSEAIVLARLRLRVIKQAEMLEEEATTLEAAARVTKKREAPKRPFGPRRSRHLPI
jgi:hypothetical protein